MMEKLNALPDIAALLEEHRENVDLLRAAVADTVIANAPEIDADRYDDTMLLRYMLSFKTVDAAAAAMTKAAEFRAKHADVLKAARSTTPVRVRAE